LCYLWSSTLFLYFEIQSVGCDWREFCNSLISARHWAVQAVQLNVSIFLCLFIYLLLFFRRFPCKLFFIKRKLRWILNVYHILVISNDLLTTHCYFSKMIANSSDLNPNKSFSHVYAGLFAVIIQILIIWNIIFKRSKVFKLPEMYWFAC
jgi:hypothetical protein